MAAPAAPATTLFQAFLATDDAAQAGSALLAAALRADPHLLPEALSHKAMAQRWTGRIGALLQAKSNDLRLAGLRLVAVAAEQAASQIGESLTQWAATVVSWLKRNDLAALHAEVHATVQLVLQRAAAIPSLKRDMTSAVLSKWLQIVTEAAAQPASQVGAFDAISAVAPYYPGSFRPHLDKLQHALVAALPAHPAAVVRCWTALLASHPPGKPASGGNQSGPLDPWGQQVLRILGSCHRLLSRALDCFEEDAWRGAELPPYDGVLAGVPARLSGAAALPTLLQRLEGWLALLAAMLGTSTAAAVTVPVDLLLGLAQRLLALSGLTRTVPHADHGHVHAARALFPLLHRHALELATAAMARVGPHALPAAGTVAAWATDVVTSTSPVAAPLREAAWQLWARAAALTRVGLDAAESSRAAAVSAAMVRDLAGVSALLGVGLDGGRSELASLAQAGKTDCAASGGALTGAGAVALLDAIYHFLRQVPASDSGAGKAGTGGLGHRAGGYGGAAPVSAEAVLAARTAVERAVLALALQETARPHVPGTAGHVEWAGAVSRGAVVAALMRCVLPVATVRGQRVASPALALAVRCLRQGLASPYAEVRQLCQDATDALTPQLHPLLPSLHRYTVQDLQHAAAAAAAAAAVVSDGPAVAAAAATPAEEATPATLLDGAAPATELPAEALASGDRKRPRVAIDDDGTNEVDRAAADTVQPAPAAPAPAHAAWAQPPPAPAAAAAPAPTAPAPEVPAAEVVQSVWSSRPAAPPQPKRQLVAPSAAAAAAAATASTPADEEEDDDMPDIVDADPDSDADEAAY